MTGLSGNRDLLRMAWNCLELLSRDCYVIATSSKLDDGMRGKITVKGLAKLKKADTDQFLWDEELPGFGVKLTKAGRRSYILQYRTGGRGSPTKRYVIDPSGLMAPEEARGIAKELLVEIGQGGDPASERAQGKLRTIEALIDGFEKSREEKGRRSSGDMAKLLRRELLAGWGARAAVDIRRSDVSLLLDGIKTRGHAQTANKLRRVMHAMFKWALAREWVRANPVAGIEAPAEEVSRDRVLTDAELAEIWHACADLPAAWDAAVKVLILTGQRRNEVGGLLKEELDLPGALWTIKAERSKNGIADLTQLAPQVVAVLAGLPKFEKCPYALTNDGRRPIGGWSQLKTDLDSAILERRKQAAKAAGLDPEKVEPMKPWTLHDLRRTAATGMAALGIMPNIIDRVLHHSRKRRGIIAVYDRHEYAAERRDALVRWAAKVDALVEAEPSSRAEAAA
jgi:integrase